MSQQVLDGPDVDAAFQQVGGSRAPWQGRETDWSEATAPLGVREPWGGDRVKGMSEGMAGGAFGEARFCRSILELAARCGVIFG